MKLEFSIIIVFLHLTVLDATPFVHPHARVHPGKIQEATKTTESSPPVQSNTTDSGIFHNSSETEAASTPVGPDNRSSNSSNDVSNSTATAEIQDDISNNGGDNSNNNSTSAEIQDAVSSGSSSSTNITSRNNTNSTASAEIQDDVTNATSVSSSNNNASSSTISAEIQDDVINATTGNTSQATAETTASASDCEDSCQIPADIQERFQELQRTMNADCPSLFVFPENDPLNKTYNVTDIFPENVMRHLYKKDPSACVSKVEDLPGAPGQENYLEDTSFCPWYYELDYNAFRYPPVLASAECQCTDCVEYDDKDAGCEKVYYKFWVLMRKSNKCVNGFYEYELVQIEHPVGCTCARTRVAASN